MEDNSAKVQFVVCIKNDDCEDLELRKIYEVLPDETASAEDYLRVIDETGEDYLYPAIYFYPVELPQAVRDTLRIAA